MLATVASASLLGARGRAVTVEVHVSNGVPSFTIVGQPDASCREARDSVRAAVLSSGLSWPLKRVTVNLAPSTIRKIGPGLDVAVAIGVLVATEQLPPGAVESSAFIGELGLDGSLRRVPGIVPLVAALAADSVVVPAGCGSEARLVERHLVREVRALTEVVDALRERAPWPDDSSPAGAEESEEQVDLADVRGQAFGRLAIEVAAAGGHHLLMVGPPGAGKTMLAHRLTGLLPPLTPDRALEATMVHSAAGLTLPRGGLIRRAPLRAPHHSASMAAVVGGGSSWVRPGEVSLAHGGVLFLDELGEFQPSVLDALRQPLEEGEVRVARAHSSVVLPAKVLLVAAMNPCPCGEGDEPGTCRCSIASRERYRRRVSGPLLDRFDVRVVISRPSIEELLSEQHAEPTAAAAARVASARARSLARGFPCNAEVPPSRLDEVMPLTAGARRVLERALQGGRLSARGLHRVRRVGQTLADLAGDDGPLSDGHVAEAMLLRVDLELDRRVA